MGLKFNPFTGKLDFTGSAVAGATGATGPAGNQGSTGATGLQGATGLTGAGGASGYWGAFWSNQDQSAANTTTAYPITLNNTDPNSTGVSVVSNSRVTFANAGVYNIQFSAQADRVSGSGSDSIDIWFRKNGTDIPESNTVVTVAGGTAAAKTVAAWNYMLNLAAGDYVELVWRTSDINLQLIHEGTATSPTRPAIPSVIVTAQQVMYTQLGATGATGATGAVAPGGSVGAVDNAVLRADVGTGIVQNSGIIIDDVATATQDNVAIRNNSAATNSALVLTPKGTGAFILGPKPDGTATGGNARGANATDLQTGTRSAATRVASGANSFAAGTNNTASGAQSVAFGSGCTASNSWTFSCGRDNTSQTGDYTTTVGGQNNIANSFSSIVAGGNSSTASGSYAGICGGHQTLADRLAMQAHAAGQFSAKGDAQRARFVMRCKTTTNTAVEMALDGSTTYLSIPSGKYLTGTINIAGIKSDGSATASYIRQFSIKNVAATTTLIGTVNTIGIDTASLTSISITANDASDYLSVQVTGILSETWRWVASVDVVEVAYGT